MSNSTTTPPIVSYNDFLKACSCSKKYLPTDSNSVLLSGEAPMDLIGFFYQIAKQRLSPAAYELFVKTVDGAPMFDSDFLKNQTMGVSEDCKKKAKQFASDIKPLLKSLCKSYSKEHKKLAKIMRNVMAMISYLSEEDLAVTLAIISLDDLYYCESPAAPINILITVMENMVGRLDKTRATESQPGVIIPVKIDRSVELYLISDPDYELL